MRKVFLVVGIISVFGIVLIFNISSVEAGTIGFYLGGAGGTTNGSVRTNINFSSVVGTDTLNKTRYQFENQGTGGEIMTIHSLETPEPNSPGYMAIHESYVSPNNLNNNYYSVKEKGSSGIIEAFGDESQIGKFEAAVGAGMGVTGGFLGTTTWKADNGAIGQTIVPSYGNGIFKSGGAAEYSLYYGPNVGMPGDPLHSQVCPWSDTPASEISVLSQERIDYGITQFGQWTFQGTKMFSPPIPE